MDQLILFNQSPSPNLPLIKRFPRLFKLNPGKKVLQFRTPGTTLTAKGLLPHSILYRLGHDRDLPINTQTEPENIRNIGRFLRQAHTTAGDIHLFVPIDATNTLLSGSSLDAYLRIFSQSSIPVITHMVIWLATPSEIRYLQQLIQSVGLQLGPQLNITDLFNRQLARSYIRKHLTNRFQDSVVFLLVNDPTALGLLSDEIHQFTGNVPGSFDRVIESPDDKLSSHQTGHTEWLTNNPDLARYYWGDEIMAQATVVDGTSLEQLTHPTTPYRVTLLDQKSSVWDRQLANLVESRPTTVYWLDPFRLDSHLVFQPNS